jgi:hypothetical protein
MRYVNVAALLALCVAASAFGADTDSSADGPGGPLAVFDAQGKYVGPLVSFVDQSIAAVITVNGATIVVPISRAVSSSGHLSASSFAWSSTDPFVSYPTADCSGPPIVLSTTITGAGDAAPVRPSLTIRTGSAAITYIAPDTYSSSLPNASQVQVGSSACATFPVITSLSGWMPASTYPLSQNYPEPLTVRIDDRRGRR